MDLRSLTSLLSISLLSHTQEINQEKTKYQICNLNLNLNSRERSLKIEDFRNGDALQNPGTSRPATKSIPITYLPNSFHFELVQQFKVRPNGIKIRFFSTLSRRFPLYNPVNELQTFRTAKVSNKGPFGNTNPFKPTASRHSPARFILPTRLP